MRKDSETALLQLTPWLMHFTRRGPSARKLTLGHLGIVFAVADGELRCGDVAAAVGVHVSTATRLIRELCDIGLVTRRRDAVNRRTVLIGLTPLGRALYRGIAFATDWRCRGLVEALRAPRQRAA